MHRSPKTAALTPGTSKKRRGTILGEFRVGDIANALVGASKHGSTPLPADKSGSRKRLSKAQRDPLEKAGAAPPLELIAKPKRKSRKSALMDDGAPVGWARRQKKPKEGVYEESPKHVEGNTQKGECENVTNRLKRRDHPPKNSEGASVRKKQEEPALETQKLQQAAATEPTIHPFRNPSHAEAIAVGSDFGNAEDVENPTGRAEPP